MKQRLGSCKKKGEGKEREDKGEGKTKIYNRQGFVLVLQHDFSPCDGEAARKAFQKLIDTVMHHAEGLENYISRTAGLIFSKVRLCGDLRLYRIRNWTGIEWSPSGLVEVFRSRRRTHGEPTSR